MSRVICKRSSSKLIKKNKIMLINCQNNLLFYYVLTNIISNSLLTKWLTSSYFLTSAIPQWHPHNSGLFSKVNHTNYNFLVCDWFKKVLFSTNSLAKLLSNSSLLDSLLLDSLLSDSLISQSHSKM